MDTAAAVIGIRLLKTKLLAFAISGFYLGVAGSLWAFAYLGTVEPHGFDLSRSFQVLFIIIIGGLGSVLGNFLGRRSSCCSQSCWATSSPCCPPG